MRYSEEQLVFAAIVKNNSHRISVLPEQASDFCQKYNLPMANTVSKGMASSYDELCDLIYVSACETGSGSLETQNNGQHIILISRTDTQIGDRVLSISKVDTVEYTILKEMRVALKTLLK